MPQSARVYDYWLGGKDNFPADRALGDDLVDAVPGWTDMAAQNRRFGHHVVRSLVTDHGIRQFLDIGTGFPTPPTLHQIAQENAPETRVVYVDNDPLVLTHAHALMNSTPQGRIECIDGDLRDPRSILQDPVVAGAIDFRQPVGLSLIAMLMFLADTDDVWARVAELRDAMPPGSFLAITHPSADVSPDQMTQAVAVANRAGMTLAARPREAVARFFGDWELQQPGLVPLSAWLADGDRRNPPPADCWAGLARKPCPR